MRNIEIEEEIIRYFIIKNKQERILWELNNPKKCDGVFWHFSDTTLLKSECLQKIPSVRTISEESLFQLGQSKNVYFIGESYIGNISLANASEKANSGERCIIYFGRGTDYFQGEREYGNAERFLLKVAHSNKT